MKTYSFTIVITGEGNSERSAWEDALQSAGLSIREVRHLPDYKAEIIDNGNENGEKESVVIHPTDQLENFVCKTCFEDHKEENDLQVDEEYMQGTHGVAYPYMPLAEWTVYCEICEEVGTIEEIGMRRRSDGPETKEGSTESIC